MIDPAKQIEQERNKAVRVEAEQFTRDNLQACCAEVLEWQGTGILTQGKVRALAAIYRGSAQVSDGDELRVAEATIQREAMRFTARATPVSPAPDLFSAIMNLRCKPNEPMTYKIGHRDARHAAAELVSAYLASVGAQVAGEPFAWAIMGIDRHKGRAPILTVYTKSEASEYRSEHVVALYTAPVPAPAPVAVAPVAGEGLTEYLMREMPAGTVIGDPAWWASKIARALAIQAERQPQPAADAWPEEPTDAMQAAGAQAIRFDTTILNKMFTANAVYRAMRAAALQQDQQAGKDGA